MRRNVMGNGLSQCLLCGEVLGFLGSSSVFCKDCRKKVCTKCGIEASPGQKRPLWLCKICSEQREVGRPGGREGRPGGREGRPGGREGWAGGCVLRQGWVDGQGGGGEGWAGADVLSDGDGWTVRVTGKGVSGTDVLSDEGGWTVTGRGFSGGQGRTDHPGRKARRDSLLAGHLPHAGVVGSTAGRVQGFSGKPHTVSVRACGVCGGRCYGNGCSYPRVNVDCVPGTAVSSLHV
uniref:FYVE-type domain-containing protein n=1 Tax=Macaca fascicularis TaxID=9541 RepID=A0A7N9C9R2_MACFA